LRREADGARAVRLTSIKAARPSRRGDDHAAVWVVRRWEATGRRLLNGVWPGYPAVAPLAAEDRSPARVDRTARERLAHGSIAAGHVHRTVGSHAPATRAARYDADEARYLAPRVSGCCGVLQYQADTKRVEKRDAKRVAKRVCEQGAWTRRAGADQTREAEAGEPDAAGRSRGTEFRVAIWWTTLERLSDALSTDPTGQQLSKRHPLGAEPARACPSVPVIPAHPLDWGNGVGW